LRESGETGVTSEVAQASMSMLARSQAEHELEQEEENRPCHRVNNKKTYQFKQKPFFTAVL
jgi:hypothetical protein